MIRDTFISVLDLIVFPGVLHWQGMFLSWFFIRSVRGGLRPAKRREKQTGMEEELELIPQIVINRK